MLKRLTIGMMLLIMLVTPAAATSGYLVPADNSVANPGDTVDVAVWVSVDDPNGCTGGTIIITYCDTCADAIAYTPAPAGTWSMNTCNSDTAGQEVITLIAAPPQSGDLLVGTLTVECMSPGDCLTPLEFDGSSALGNGTMGQIPDVEWINGTFTCGTQECLGDCYNDTGVLVASDVTCYDCIGTDGWVVWENYEFDSPCSPGTTVPRRSYDYCPECCDGVNNSDGDDLIDWPADPECACCLDETEAIDEGCPVECVPELPTLALAGIGILGIALLARKRD
jgi:hypothetical protein